MDIRIGSGPDSWGVWFGDDPKQTPWHRYLDEVAEAGYAWTELGPRGYLPEDVDTLRRELDARDLRVSGTFMMTHLEDEAAWPETEQWARASAELLQKLDARYLVIIDDTYSDLWTGEPTRQSRLDDAAWDRLIATTDRICRIVRDDYGMVGAFHHHAETHVEHPGDIERFLRDTDPEVVNLCLDTGHYAYRHGDSADLMRHHHERIPYLHLKSVDGKLRDDVNLRGTPFATAVADGVFVEPQEGVVDFDAFRAVLGEIDYEGFAIVEQDMSPAPFDKPLPIARRTREYLRDTGWGERR